MARATSATTTRRLVKITDALGPTQLLVQWLQQAQQDYPSFSAYATYVNATPNSNPMLWLPVQVASWVRERMAGLAEREVNPEIDRLVTAALGCVALVRQVNGAIIGDRHTDAIELDLLEAIAPLVADGRADGVLAERWAAHVARLLHEAMTWDLAVAQVAERYFTGQSPLFLAEAEHLAQTRARTEALALLATKPGRGKRHHAIDPARIAREATASVPDLIAQLRTAARNEVELLFEARPALVYVQERIAATRQEKAAR
jgi:hypothetical protein